MENENNNSINFDYFRWLEKYTEKNSFFSDEPSKEMDPETKENVTNLPKFYKFICEYAKKNNIESKSNYGKYGDGYHYSIKYNNAIYNIGFQFDTFDMPYYFCNRVPIDIIQFSDVSQEPSKRI